jgi:hypothetical protein
MEDGRMIAKRDVLFRHPFNMIVGGASGSGKTEWVHKFLRHYQRLIDVRIKNVVYCYGVYNERVLDIRRMHIETHLGLPSEEFINSRAKPLLLVLDDLMMDAGSEFLDLLFTRGSHHWGVSVVFVTQNMFEKSLKTARNNSHYLVLMRNPAGQLQIRNLGVQLFPRRLNYFLEAYKDATSKNFGYLLVDVHPSSPDLVRLRSSIFPGDVQILHTPKE